MVYRIAIEELGIANDTATFEGATPGEVWRQVARHLHDKHKIDIPEVDDVMGADGPVFIPPRYDNAIAGQQSPIVPAAGDLNSEDDRGVNTIVTRLIEKLRMGEQGSASGDIVPPGSTESLLP